MVTLTYLAACTTSGAVGHRHAAPAPAQSGLHGQGGLVPGLALRWPGRSGHRRGLAEGGVRRARRAVGAARRAHRRVHRGAAHAVVRRHVVLSTARPTPARCEMFPKPIQQPHPPLHIGGETDAALRRAARTGQGWHTFNRSPDELAAGLAKLDQFLDEAGRSRDDLRITVCPYFNQLTPEWSSSTPRPVPTPWPPSSSASARRRGADLRRARGLPGGRHEGRGLNSGGGPSLPRCRPDWALGMNSRGTFHTYG
jgi:hypothetical protein